MRTMQVTVPPGVTPGQSFIVIAPDSSQMQVIASVPPGQTMTIQTPAPPPVVAVQAMSEPVASVTYPSATMMSTPIAAHQGSVELQQVSSTINDPQFAGDRTKIQKGMTARTQTSSISLSSWEVKDPSCYEKICLALKCSSADTKRAYIYIRENSLELNDTNSCWAYCNWICEIQDNVRVEYYDRPPWAKECNCAPFPWCCCLYSSRPKLEIVDLGCMCCCVKIDPLCCGKKIVIMPFEMMAPPCCCCSNRVGCCDNCCGLCGPVTGNPKIYGIFAPQPKNAEAFLQAARAMMLRGGAPVQCEEMKRSVTDRRVNGAL